MTEVKIHTLEGLHNIDKKYTIDDMGVVRDTDRGVEVQQQKTSQDYMSVRLPMIGGSNTHKNIQVHRLVALAFVPGYFKTAVVNHKDEVKDNNVKDNLEWMTSSENLAYGNAHKNRAENSKRNIRGVHYFTGAILEFKGLHDNRIQSLGMKFSRIATACRSTTISGKLYREFIWNYIKDEEPLHPVNMTTSGTALKNDEAEGLSTHNDFAPSDDLLSDTLLYRRGDSTMSRVGSMYQVVHSKGYGLFDNEKDARAFYNSKI